MVARSKRKATARSEDAPKPKRATRAKAAAVLPTASEAEADLTRPAATTSMKMVAFLRGVNVGGRTHSMKSIAETLTAAGFENVATFLASGNVIFDAPRAKLSVLDAERQVEGSLKDLFGCEIPVFCRPMDGVARLEQRIVKTAKAVNVALLKEELTEEQRKTLQALSTTEDELELLEKEFVWYSATNMSESPLFKVSFEKKLGVPVTVRNVNTLRRIVKKFG